MKEFHSALTDLFSHTLAEEINTGPVCIYGTSAISLHALVVVWLNASQISQVGFGTDRVVNSPVTVHCHCPILL